jgi:hypothetical protein
LGAAVRLFCVLACSGLLIGVYARSQTPAVVFEREHVRLFVSAKSLRVEGLYTFANAAPSECRQVLFYPFPVDSLHPREDYVLVRVHGQVIPTTSRENGVVFGIRVPANGTLPVEVVYEQTCLDGTGCYILTSTATWEAPLEHASFEVHVPDSIVLDSMTYEADRVSRRGSVRVYEFARDDFMPDEDLCLRWHVRRRE